MKILTMTTLYPNACHPDHGVFVENRLLNLLNHTAVESKVVAPVPWFPFKSEMFGRYARFASVPRKENRHGVDVLHPRYVVIPKIGMSLTPFSLYAALLPVLRRIAADGYDFDLIDAHYFYPDGVAAAMLGRALRKPVTVTARGTDINDIPHHVLPRKMILWAAANVAGMVTVCQALKDCLVELGAEADKVRVIQNGVDLEAFRPLVNGQDSVPGKGANLQLLSVGHLIPRKGHDLAIRALPDLPGAELTIVGGGPLEGKLKALVQDLSLNGRVRFRGSVPHRDLREIYGAADALVLASEREGWPNVLLEAMACGTPVLASDVWGNPEVVSSPAAGRLFPERNPEGIVHAVRDLFADPPSRAATRAFAEQHDWKYASAQQLDLFQSLVGQAGQAP